MLRFARTPNSAPTARLAPASRLHHALALGLVLSLFGAACSEPAQPAAQATDSTDPAPSGRGLLILPPEVPIEGPLTGEVDPRDNYHSFGRVRDGEVVRHVFRLENTDDAPIGITKITPSCGCTVPKVSYRTEDGELVQGRPAHTRDEVLLEIPPGVIAELELVIDTNDVSMKNVDKLLIVNVATNSPNSFYLPALEAHIYVERPFNIVPNGINLGNIARSGGGTGTVEIVQAGGFPYRIGEIIELPDGVHAELRNEQRLQRDVWILEAGFDPPLELGTRTAQVVLSVFDSNDEPARALPVPITAVAVDDIRPDPARLIVKAARDAETQALVRVKSLLAGHRFEILEAQLEESHAELLALSFEAEEADPSGRSASWSLNLRTRPPIEVQDQMLQGHVRLRLDDPQHPEVEVPYVVHLR